MYSDDHRTSCAAEREQCETLLALLRRRRPSVGLAPPDRCTAPHLAQFGESACSDGPQGASSRSRARSAPADPVPARLQILINSSSSSTPTSPPPLLSLSNELLDTIFSLAHDDEAKDFARSIPICRRLLSLQRVQLYRRVEIHRYKALKSFHRTVLGSNACAELVRHLYISARDENTVSVEPGSERRPRPRGDNGASVGPKMVTPVEFAPLVPRLPRLESLETIGLDAQLVDVVFLDQEATRLLMSLEDVEISLEDRSLVPDECDAGSWLNRLSRLPRLAYLTLRQTSFNEPILPSTPTPPTFTHLKSLVLQTGASFELPTWSGPALDVLAPSLRSLELEDWSVDWFASALETAPVSLRILSLLKSSQCITGDSPAWTPVNDVLARFKQLLQLDLGHGVFDTALPSSLTSLLVLDTLVHLTFKMTDLLTDAFLLALLVDPSHLPKLAILELEHVRSFKGLTVEAMDGLVPAFEDRAKHPHWPVWHGWREPSYPEGCSQAGLLAVVRAARARGVFLRARPVLGNAVVDAHILARARASAASLEGGEGGEGGEEGEA